MVLDYIFASCTVLALHDGLTFPGKTTLYAEGSLPLPWSIRLKIALGAAKGLAFLHEEAERPVIYRDFKTSNILLDAVSDSTNVLLPSVFLIFLLVCLS